MAKLRPHVKGSGNLERFDYWLNNFRYLRAIGKVNCIWSKFNTAMKKINDEKEPEVRTQLAREVALPIRKELVAGVDDVHRYLLASVTTNGGMGNVTNWQQHIMPTLLTEPGRELAKMLEQDLPADAIPSKSYDGPLRLIMPTIRTSLSSGEDLKLKAIILATDQPEEVTLYWRTMGERPYKVIPLTHDARGVYFAQIPTRAIESDLEYYIKASSVNHRDVFFPATAPDTGQTVVLMDEE